MRQWYLRLGDDIVGPLPLSELRSLAREGGIQPETPVSGDRQAWRPARVIRELEFRCSEDADANFSESTGSQSLVDGKVGESPTATRVPALVWILLGAVGIGVFLVLLCCGVLGVIAPGTATNISPTDSLQQTAHSTYQYWETVGSSMRSLSLAGNVSLQQQALLTTATQIEQLPVLDVDPVAVQCALNVSRGLRYCAEVSGRQNDPALFLESFARGLSGDPFGKGLEMMRESQQLRQIFENLRTEITHTRAVLSQKYGVEFPSW